MGPCDSQRFDSLNDREREHFTFIAEFSLAVLDKRPYQFEALQSAANSLTALGYYHDGLLYDKRLRELKASDALITYNLACSYALVKDTDNALRTLEEAICLGYRDHVHMVEDPDLSNLKGDPRFDKLLQLAHK